MLLNVLIAHTRTARGQTNPLFVPKSLLLLQTTGKMTVNVTFLLKKPIEGWNAFFLLADTRPTLLLALWWNVTLLQNSPHRATLWQIAQNVGSVLNLLLRLIMVDFCRGTEGVLMLPKIFFFLTYCSYNMLLLYPGSAFSAVSPNHHQIRLLIYLKIFSKSFHDLSQNLPTVDQTNIKWPNTQHL